MDETRAVARLPRLDVEITHRRLLEEDAEQLQITVQAAPSFRAVGELLRQDAMLPWLALGPMLAWQQAFQAFWAPWLVGSQLLLQRPEPPAPPEELPGDNVHPFPGPDQRGG